MLKIITNAGAGIRTLVGLRQQVLSLSPLASSGTPASYKFKNAPAGIRTRVFGSKGRNDWPDYTTGANYILSLKISNASQKIVFLSFEMGPMGFEPMAARL